MSAPKNMYLLMYNLACAAGWGYVLLHGVRHVVAAGFVAVEPKVLYDEVEQVLQVVQTAAIMEVLHALLGVVRSPFIPTLLQVSSRVVVLWGFLWAIPESQAQIGAVLCIISWACVEIPRYLFYALNVVGSCPYSLFYIRYSLFYVLYPTGISSELLTIWSSLPILKASQDTLSVRVGPLAVPGYILALLILAAYVPGSPFMYMNMIWNRKGAFRKRKAEGAKKKA